MVVRTRTLKRARELRRRMPPPELELWSLLRGRRFQGLRFRRQHPVGPFILDFYCPAARLAVELDGEQHDLRLGYDAARTAWLNRQGIRVLRFPAVAVLDEEAVEHLLDRIAAAAAPFVLPRSEDCGGGGPAKLVEGEAGALPVAGASPRAADGEGGASPSTASRSPSPAVFAAGED